MWSLFCLPATPFVFPLLFPLGHVPSSYSNNAFLSPKGHTLKCKLFCFFNKIYRNIKFPRRRTLYCASLPRPTWHEAGLGRPHITIVCSTANLKCYSPQLQKLCSLVHAGAVNSASTSCHNTAPQTNSPMCSCGIGKMYISSHLYHFPSSALLSAPSLVVRQVNA